MFRNVIDSTPMTSSVADNFFSQITGDAYNRDITFLSTLRALVAPRMKQGDYLRLKFKSSNFTQNQIAGHSSDAIIKAMFDARYSDDCEMRVHSLHAEREDNDACFKVLKSDFETVYPGWKRVEKVTEFFYKTINTLCFINPDRKSVIIFVDKMDMKKMHYLQCSIFAFLPWYFDPEKGVAADEMELIESLREKNPQKYEICIAKIAEKYDFRTEHIRKSLEGFELKYERLELCKVRNNITNIVDRINSHNSSLSELLSMKRDTEIRLLGLETKIAQSNEDSEIMDYFISNKKLYLNTVSDTSMIFVVKDYLSYFDEDLAKTIIDNPRSYIYRPDYKQHEELIPATDMKKLMYSIFIEQKLKIKFCATYQFDLGSSSVRPLSEQSYGMEFKDCTPNPHIDQYECMGSYSSIINKLLQDNNYIAAIEQCAASCKSLNFSDSTVMEYFMKTIYRLRGYTSINIRCIELPDGSVVNPIEAIKWIKSQEENADEQVNQNDT